VNDLVFKGQRWAFHGHKTSPPPPLEEVLKEVELLLLTQGLDDHAHIPTLKLIDKNLPVVCCYNARGAVVDLLGFKNVTVL
jgi:hypothetical protein